MTKTNHHQQRDDHDLSRRLSDDVLAEVLRRLAPRWLAASRCVCKAWHALIDTRRLLRADLLPLSLDGIAIQFKRHVFSEIFSRPSTPTSLSISGNIGHLLAADAWAQSIHHCNGLLLLQVYRRSNTYVVNPATGWAAPLPPCPSPCLATKGDYNSYLVFDPTVSAHYQVFSVPSLFQCNSKPEAIEKSEWPPSTFIIRVFSSVSQRWEERSFSREGEPAPGTAYYLNQPCAVYWRGSLYVLCETDSVMRISLSTNKFKLIEPPVHIGGYIREWELSQLFLGRSENGVYFASRVDQWRLRVWIIDESSGHMKWVPKHDNNLEHVLPRRARKQHVHGPWFLQDINYRYGTTLNHHLVDDKEESIYGQKFKWNSAPPDDKFEWNSDGDNNVEDKDMTKVGSPRYLNILGFHPYKEIVFFSESWKICLAYHLNTSKFQVLGNLYPTKYGDLIYMPYEREIIASFPYTPCLIEMCPRND